MARPRRAPKAEPTSDFTAEQYEFAARQLECRLAIQAPVCPGWQHGERERVKFEALDGKARWEFARDAAIAHGGSHKARALMGPPFRN